MRVKRYQGNTIIKMEMDVKLQLQDISKSNSETIDTKFNMSNTSPQTFESPIDEAKCLAFKLGNAFVKISAVISSVGQ